VKILLVNDDGYGSEGLLALEQALLAQDAHELWVVAPDGERSGLSHSITLKDPLRTRVRGPRRFDHSGSPADCVLTALLGLMPQHPDLVLSGINMGPNLGTDITYSGTAAGARQAALMGVCGVAVSLNAFGPPWHFEPLARFVAEHLQEFLQFWDGSFFLNINGPNSLVLDAPVEITHPCIRKYNDKLERFEAPRGDDYWFLHGAPIDSSHEIGSDWNAVSRSCISLSPIHLHPQNNPVDALYREQFAKLGDD
jgi:5'-nucleotidase